MANPVKAIDAILDGEKRVCGHTVYPISVARYALLEKIDSPLLTGKENLQKTIQSLYIMTQPAEKLAQSAIDGRLEVDAMVWSDSVDIRQLKEIIEEIRRRLSDLLYLAPDGENDGKKKAPTAG